MIHETYAALLNRKLIARSPDPRFIIVQRDLLASVLSRHVDTIWVDAAWYVTRYPDVARRDGAEEAGHAEAHYRQFGFYEHRMPYAITVDADWYLAQYPYIKTGIEQHVFDDAQDHFEKVGYREGRFPFAHFALKTKRRPAA